MDAKQNSNVPEKKISNKWAFITIPANIATGPISALIILQILALGGTVLDVSYAITLGIAISIPASYFWGKISDIYNSRRRQIMISYLGITISIFALLFAKSILLVALAYMALNFFSIANATPLNLLVMETTAKEHWPSTFSSLQTLSSVGSTVGYVIAVFATSALNLNSLILLLVLASIISILMTNKLVYSPAVKATRETFASNSFAFISRMLMHPIIFIKDPTSKLLRRLSTIRNTSYSHFNYVTILYAAGFVFFMGSAIFNAIYPAALSQSGISHSNIFLVLLMGMLLQTTTFFYSGHFVETHVTRSVIRRSLVLRTICYFLSGAAFILLSGYNLFVSSIILYPIAAGIAYSLFYTASYALVFEALGNIDKGSALGIYSTVASFGTLFGALAAGQIAFHFGYGVTFIVAGLLLALTLYLFMILPKRTPDVKK